ncbi:MAG: restriction endonuclease, partial [Blautia obeum]
MVCCRYNILQICTTSIAILLNVSFTRTAIQFYIIQETQHMDGYEFEYQCAKILKRKHFSKIKVTQSSGDQGIDIIA